jgi:phosphotransferase system enzyme I (PtsI)
MHSPATKRIELAGVSIAPGCTLGKAHLLRQISLEALEVNRFPVVDISAEIERLDRAVRQTRAQLEELRTQVHADHSHDLVGILGAQLALLEDAELLDKIRTTIRDRAVNTEYLIATEIRQVEAVFRNLKDEVMRSRFLDVQDVHHRLLRNLLEIEHVRTNPFRRLTSPVVLVADRMLPSDIALLELDKILGIIIEEGSTVSHVAIIAKSLGIPAITEVTHATSRIRTGDELLLKADDGRAVVHPEAADRTWYEKSRPPPATRHTARNKAMEPLPPCQTADGTHITLDANIGSLREVNEALHAGAEGIGLLRSEFFYLAHQEMPTLEAETDFYCDVLRGLHRRPVTIRLLDIGADKPLPYLQLPPEENPQLGNRGIRLLLRNPDLLQRHLRSILRASDQGTLRLLIPFVSTLHDLDRMLNVIHELCREEKIPRERFHIGIMVEIPSVALDADPFLKRVDFVSIGTNDLVQYLFAACRESSHLQEYRLSHHPAMLRLLHAVTCAGKAHGKAVSVCGEMASDPALALLLVGLGLRSLSLQANALPQVRDSIQKHSLAALEKLTRAALECDRAEEVMALLKGLRPG